MATCKSNAVFLVPAENPTATYTIDFLGRTINGGNSTWCYSVSVKGNPGLSHWDLGVLESCPEKLRDKLLLVTRNGVELQEGTGYVLGTNDGVTGIKFEVGVEEEQSPVVYCITLKGIYEFTSVDVAVKGGPTPAQFEESALCGPSCTVEPQCCNTCQAVTDLLESIALQEAGLAHIINAEGEKIQKAAAMQNATVDDLVKINQSVSNTLIKVTKLEMILEFKLEEVGKIKCPACTVCQSCPVCQTAVKK